MPKSLIYAAFGYVRTEYGQQRWDFLQFKTELPLLRETGEAKWFFLLLWSSPLVVHAAFVLKSRNVDGVPVEKYKKSHKNMHGTHFPAHKMALLNLNVPALLRN